MELLCEPDPYSPLRKLSLLFLDAPTLSEVYLGKCWCIDVEEQGNSKCYQHYKKAGAMNALINIKGLDGIQGPLYVGAGCVFNRQAFDGYDPQLSEKRPKMTCHCRTSWCYCYCGGSTKSKSKKKAGRETEEGLEGYDELEKSSLMSQKNTEKRFGQSLDFIASSFVEYGGLPEGTNTTPLIKESVHVISCGYKEKTKWGKEIGWIKDLWFIYRRYIDWVDGTNFRLLDDCPPLSFPQRSDGKYSFNLSIVVNTKASIFSLVWVQIVPFLPKPTGPVLKQCGEECYSNSVYSLEPE
ncbi:Cellulose synthase [Quillaja saponaria]|uniref:Cellulose synthase n=1 Tax=Quillaja saponaria TaxID=32244 RepID=A0AAD7Q0H9_QUISA|nr:Cellulose synthase [Quillaja saponaria]